jgi:hypothetical protein
VAVAERERAEAALERQGLIGHEVRIFPPATVFNRFGC